MSILKNPYYIDLDFEDCVLPKYIKQPLTTVLANNTFPHMLFIEPETETQNIVANALAKKINAKLMGIIFNPENSQSETESGNQTLFELKNLLKGFSDAGLRKVFIIEWFNDFPKEKIAELVELISAETYHRFIIYNLGSNKFLLQQFKKFPQISFYFTVKHSLDEEQYFWQQCNDLLAKFSLVMTAEQKQQLSENYLMWKFLPSKEIWQKLYHPIEFINLIPERKNCYRKSSFLNLKLMK